MSFVENKFTLYLSKNLNVFVEANFCELNLKCGALVIRAGTGSQNFPTYELSLSFTTDPTWST